MSVQDRKLHLIFLLSLFSSSEAQIVYRTRRTSSVGRIIGGCIVAAFFLLFLFCLCLVMVRRRRARAGGYGGGQPSTLWSRKPLFGGPWGRSNANNDFAYGGPGNNPQAGYNYQPSYANNSFGGGFRQQAPFNNASAAAPPYQGGNYGPAGQTYDAPPGPPPPAYTKGQ